MSSYYIILNIRVYSCDIFSPFALVVHFFIYFCGTLFSIFSSFLSFCWVFLFLGSCCLHDRGCSCMIVDQRRRRWGLTNWYDGEDINQDLDYCFVRRFLTASVIHFKSMRNTLVNLWHSGGGVSKSNLEEKSFIMILLSIGLWKGGLALSIITFCWFRRLKSVKII